jgi:FemAB family protein
VNAGLIAEALAGSGLEAAPFSAGPVARSTTWSAVWSALPHQPVAASRAMLDYQHSYFRGAGWVLDEISLVLLNDRQPCGLWPLSLGGPPGSPRLCSAGAPVQAPLFVGRLSPRTIKKVTGHAIKFMQRLSEAARLPPVQAEQGVDPTATAAGASEWHHQCMAAGATPTLRHDLFADLSPPLVDIRASFRKSFRPLINAGLHSWQVFVMTQANAEPGPWQEFKQLHRDAAGRSTRSDTSWSLQQAMVADGHAFLIGLRDPASGRLVGAGFFQTTRDEGVYAVGAYDRSLFHKPLGHVVQQVAIETLKAIGIRWYRIGDRPFAQDLPAPSDKQLSIEAFKQGFASHLFGRIEFTFPPCGLTESSSAIEARPPWIISPSFTPRHLGFLGVFGRSPR